MKPMPPRWSRLGLALTAMYLLVTLAAVSAAPWDAGEGDPKGRFVLLQLPIALQLAAIPETVLRQLVDIPWAVAYLIIWPPTAFVLYALGHFVGWMFRSLSR